LDLDTKKTIFSLVNSYENEMIDFASTLISISSENPPGTGYKKCADAIASKLSEIGFECIRHRDCILAYFGTGHRTFYFHGHYDTVPISTPGQLEPRLDHGKLYGRGSSDMKGGLATMMFAAKAIKESGVKLAGRLGIAMVPDEETAGARGSSYLFSQKLIDREAIGMLLPEPTSGVIWNASRGAISARIVVKGKSSHVGLQCQGVNAFDGMITAANEFFKLKKIVERRITKFRITPEAARHSILLLGGQIAGGTNFNIVPSECSFTIDRRINPEEDFEIEKERISSVVDNLRKRGIKIQMEILQEGSSAASPEKGNVAQALTSSIIEVNGRRAKFELCPGLLESRFYARQNIPAYAYGPGLLSVSHGPNEYIETRRIIRFATIYALTAARLLEATGKLGQSTISE
jgi:succinyl-diaminopimelate desuccinylase